MASPGLREMYFTEHWHWDDTDVFVYASLFWCHEQKYILVAGSNTMWWPMVDGIAIGMTNVMLQLIESPNDYKRSILI